MFFWNAKEGKLCGQKNKVSIPIYWEGQYVKTVERVVYTCESGVSREEKVSFIDSFLGGELLYVLELADAYRQDVQNCVSVMPVKDWIWTHDVTDMVHWLGDNGFFQIGRCVRCLQNPDEKTSDYDLYENFVDELFNRQLVKCEVMEREYLQ